MTDSMGSGLPVSRLAGVRVASQCMIAAGGLCVAMREVKWAMLAGVFVGWPEERVVGTWERGVGEEWDLVAATDLITPDLANIPTPAFKEIVHSE